MHFFIHNFEKNELGMIEFFEVKIHLKSHYQSVILQILLMEYNCFKISYCLNLAQAFMLNYQLMMT